MHYSDFIQSLDLKLAEYFSAHKEYIQCKIGCSACCEKGDYPLSALELEYLMKGYIALNSDTKQIVQNQIKTMKKGGACPFLIDKKCSIYPYRPIICRVHGLAYICKEHTVKLPYCVNYGKNYSNVYKNNEFLITPILAKLDTPNLLKDCDYGEIKNLYDWIKH